MESCVLYCSGCIKEIPAGHGAALSCQCFFCPSCFPLIDNLGRRRLPQRCPACHTSHPDVVSLHPKEAPDEIKHLIGNPNSQLEEIAEQVSFHCSHYRSIIQAAQAKIKELQKALADKQQQEQLLYQQGAAQRLLNSLRYIYIYIYTHTHIYIYIYTYT